MSNPSGTEEIKETPILDIGSVENEKERKKIIKQMKKQRKKEKSAKTGKKPKIIRIIVIVVIILLLGGCILSKYLLPSETVPTVNVTQAVKGDIEYTLDTSGTVVTGEKKTYYSPVNAMVADCTVAVGDTVKKGDVIATYDLEDLQKQYDQATLEKKSTDYDLASSLEESAESASDGSEAAGKVSALQGQISQKEAEIADLENRYDNASSSENDTKTSLTDELTQISKDKIDAQADLEKYTTELADTSLSASEKKAIQKKIDDINADLTDWGKREVEINATLSSSATTSSADLQTKLAAAKEDLATLQADLAEQESIVTASESGQLSESQKAKLEVQQELSKYSVMSAEELLAEAKKGITAEFDGIVTDVQISDGGTAAQGSVICTVADENNINIDVSLSKYDLEDVAIGQLADVTIVGNEYEGEVTKISRIASSDASAAAAGASSTGASTVNAVIHVTNPDEKIYLGVEGKALVHLDNAEGVLMIPSESLNIGKTGEFVYVVENGIVEKREITAGIASSDYVEIKKGLKEGDKVITNITSDITEGSVVIENEEENATMDNSTDSSTDAQE